VSAQTICPGVWWIGVRHPDLKVFDDLLPTKSGTTYNAYLLRGAKVAVVDTVKAKFADEFMANLGSQVDPKSIDAIIVNHAEPDHSGTLERLIAAAPQARVLGTRPALHYLGDLLNKPFNGHAVADGETLDLGGKTVRFVHAPFLHWPDTMMSYVVEDRALLSCDAFGAHFCGEGLFDDECKPYEDDFRLYYEGIMRPFRDKVLEAVAKVDALDVAWIGPSHGPVLRRGWKERVEAYRAWATVPRGLRPLVGIFYATAHGNTKKMVDAVAAGVKDAESDVEVLHVTEADWMAQRDLMEKACGLMFASFTVVRDAPKPMWETLAWLSTVKPSARAAAAFGSFGWSGEAVGMIERRLEAMRLNVFGGAPKVRFAPTDADLAAFREWGRSFALSLKECR